MHGAFPLSAELAQVLEQGLTPEETQGSMQRGAAGVGRRHTAHRHRGRRGVQEDDHRERTRTFKSDSNGDEENWRVRCDPTAPRSRSEEEILTRQLQRRQSVRGAAQELGPAPRSDEDELKERQQRRRRAERGEAREPLRPPPRSWIDNCVADFHQTLQTHDPRADRTGTSAAVSVPPSSDGEPWKGGRAPARAARPTTPLGRRLPATAARKRETAAPPRELGRAHPLGGGGRRHANDHTNLRQLCRPSIDVRREDVQGPVQPLLRGRTPAPPAHGQPPAARLPGGWWRWCEATASKSTRAQLNTAYGFARMSTSTGQTQRGQGPRVFVAQGHVYPSTSRPTRRTTTELGQAFFMEEGEAQRVRSRLMLTHVPTDMIACLHETLEEHNPYTRFYHTVRETLLETPGRQGAAAPPQVRHGPQRRRGSPSTRSSNTLTRATSLPTRPPFASSSTGSTASPHMSRSCPCTSRGNRWSTSRPESSRRRWPTPSARSSRPTSR